LAAILEISLTEFFSQSFSMDSLLKNLFDKISSCLGVCTLAPLFLFLAILIKFEDKGPVFHRGLRVGRHGKLFRIFKFCTMVGNAENIGGPSTADDDPRITGIGLLVRGHYSCNMWSAILQNRLGASERSECPDMGEKIQVGCYGMWIIHLFGWTLKSLP
jgi:hypothetical protein